MNNDKCTVPSDGWYCTRAKGHPGPCAAHPGQAPEPETREEQRARAFKKVLAMPDSEQEHMIGPAFQPEGEAVPAKVEIVDTIGKSQAFKSAAMATQTVGWNKETVDHLIAVTDAHIDAKMAEAREIATQHMRDVQQPIADAQARIIESWKKRAEKAEAERDQWKAQHADMVKRCALLRERDDLPVDRIPAYEELVRLQAIAAQVVSKETVQQAGKSVQPVRSEHYDELKATLESAWKIMNSLSLLQLRVGPVGSHARGCMHKITKALRHLDALATPPAIPQQAGRAVDERGRHERTGKHAFEFAKRHGWKDDGEGAFEFVQRISYTTGRDDALTAPPASAAPVKFHEVFENSWVLPELEGIMANAKGDQYRALNIVLMILRDGREWDVAADDWKPI